MLPSTLKSLFICISLLVASLAASEVYKWIDEDGTVHYSDRKPPNTETTIVKTTGTRITAPATDSVEHQLDDLSKRQETEQLKAQQEAEVAETTQSTAEYCRSLRASLETLNNNSRVRVEDENGELRYLTAEEMVEKRRSNEQSLQEHCKSV